MGLPPKDTSSNKIVNASFTVGAEASNVINVAIQLEWANGEELDRIGCVWAYLSDSASGDGVTAAVPDGGVAIGTDGSIIVEATTDAVFLLQSEADGDIDLDITDTTGTPTWYMVVVLPSGDIAVSDAITFA